MGEVSGKWLCQRSSVFGGGQTDEFRHLQSAVRRGIDALRVRGRPQDAWNDSMRLQEIMFQGSRSDRCGLTSVRRLRGIALSSRRITSSAWGFNQTLEDFSRCAE